MTPKIKFTYIDAKGRGEPIRLALVAGGVEFEDERISGPEMMKRKESGKFIFGSVPVMEVDGEIFGESGAQLRYAANVAGIAPKSAVCALKVDMVIDAVESVLIAAYKDKSEESRKKFVETDLPRYFGPIDSLIAKTEGPFLLGDKISAADIKLYVTVYLITNHLDHVPSNCVEKFVAITDACKAVEENERIKKYYASK